MKMILSTWLCGVSLALGQTAAPERLTSRSSGMLFSCLIQCQVECIEVSLEDMTNLLFLRDQSFSDANLLRKQLQQMVAQKKAKVVDTMILVGHNGKCAISESLMEYVYESEYEYDMPPIGNGAEGVGGLGIGPVDPSKHILIPKQHVPVCFETRDVGGRLAIAPMVSNDFKQIDLRFDWHITDHEGEKAWMDYKDQNNNAYKVQMPIFYTKRIATSISCTPSTYTLVSTVDPQDEKGRRDPSRKWLIFAKCELQHGH
jgi:hypothetical protein